MHINDLLKIAVERKASDLHLKVGAFPIIRVDGTLLPLADMRRLMQEDTIAMAFSIMSARQKEKFKNNFEIDIAYNVPNLGPFPLQHLPAAGHGRPGPARHSGQDPVDQGAAAAAGPREDLPGAARPGPRAPGTTGSGKSTVARRDDRPHQLHPQRARDDGRGPDRVPPSRQEVDRQPARGRRRHEGLLARRCAARCARTPT